MHAVFLLCFFALFLIPFFVCFFHPFFCHEVPRNTNLLGYHVTVNGQPVEARRAQSRQVYWDLSCGDPGQSAVWYGDCLYPGACGA